MTSAAPSVLPLWNSMPLCTRIVQTSPALLCSIDSASPLNASLNFESKPTSVSQPVTIRAWSGRVTMFWPSMKSFVEPPDTPIRNVPPRFGVAASTASRPALADSPSALEPRMTAPPAAARRSRSALVRWPWEPASGPPWTSWSVIVSPPYRRGCSADTRRAQGYESRGHCAMLVCMLQQRHSVEQRTRSLDSLFAPRSVAIVGASRDPRKWGGLLARGALKGRHRRAVALVNRNGGQILGCESHRSLGELPDAPELVVACIPAAALEQTVDDALGVGARAIVGISAGLGEAQERALGASFARHDTTRLIALYVEDFRDGRAFMRAAAAAGKPVVLLSGGGSEAGVRAARSHTRALVSDVTVVDAACRTAGIVRVSTPRELVDAAKALLHGRRPRGRRLAVLGDGGGHGVVAADVATRHGLEPPL